MNCKIGKSGRIFRLIAGIGIIVIGLIFQSWWGLLGIVPIATSLMNFCPINGFFKRNTDELPGNE